VVPKPAGALPVSATNLHDLTIDTIERDRVR